MKSILVTLCLVLSLVGVCAAGHYYGGVAYYSGTKGQIAVTNVSGTIRYITAGTCRVFMNASSAYSYPVAANTQYEATPNTNVSQLVFKCNSSTVGVNTIRVIK